MGAVDLRVAGMGIGRVPRVESADAVQRVIATQPPGDVALISLASVQDERLIRGLTARAGTECSC